MVIAPLPIANCRLQSQALIEVRRMNQTVRNSFLIAVALSATSSLTLAATPPTSQPARGAGAVIWNPALFTYERAPDFAVEETTPTDAQVDFRFRPPQMKPDTLAPKATDTPAKPVTIGPVDIVRLRFRDADDDIVTAL